MKLKIALISLVCVVSLAAQSVQAGWLDKLESLLGNDKAGSAESAGTSSVLTNDEISRAFKQALDIGSRKVVDQLGKADAFNADSAIRIPLPETMQTVKKWLGKVGMDDSLNDLEVSLNRAAEAAVPQAKALFIDTIKQMTFEDVKAIYKGSDDAATRYFQEKMTPALSSAMQPVVDKSLAEVGAIKLYDDVMGDYQSIPFVPDVKGNLTAHVVEGGLRGVFYYLAKEEAEIRKNPIKHTTSLLKRVFGR